MQRPKTSEASVALSTGKYTLNRKIFMWKFMSFITWKTIYTKLCNLASTCSIPFTLSSSQLHIFCRRCVQLLLVILSSHSHYIHIHIYANILSALVFLLHFFLLLFHRIQPAFLVVFHSFNQFDPFHFNFVFFFIENSVCGADICKITHTINVQTASCQYKSWWNESIPYHTTSNTPNARVFKHFRFPLASSSRKERQL